MKIRSLDDLENSLDREFSWRKRELTTLKLYLDGAREHQKSVCFRSAIVLLYAHWEGLTKECAKCYLSYLNSQGISYSSLQSCFLIFAVKSLVNSEGKPNLNNFDKFSDCSKFFSQPVTEKFKVDPASSISTRENQNMTSTEFRFLIGKIGLTYLPKYESREHMIDEQLLRYRNEIAHGEQLHEKSEDLPKIFSLLSSSILELLEQMRLDVITASESKCYLLKESK